MTKLFNLTNVNLNSFNSSESAKSVYSLLNPSCDYTAIRGEEHTGNPDNRITS